MQMGTNDANKIVHKELSYKLTGIFFKVHNKLGRFRSERQYADKVEQHFEEKGVSYKREFSLAGDAKGNRVDFLVDGKIIVDIKAKKMITKEDYYQMMRYLRSGGLKLGLIVNFRNTYLKAIRVLNVFAER